MNALPHYNRCFLLILDCSFQDNIKAVNLFPGFRRFFYIQSEAVAVLKPLIYSLDRIIDFSYVRWNPEYNKPTPAWLSHQFSFDIGFQTPYRFSRFPIDKGKINCSVFCNSKRGTVE